MHHLWTKEKLFHFLSFSIFLDMFTLRPLLRTIPTVQATIRQVPKAYFATVPKDIKEQQKPKITSERKQYKPEEVQAFIKKVYT